MFEYSPTAVYESKLIPGVKYHLRKMSNGRRKEFTAATATIHAEISRMAREMDVVDEELKRAGEAAKLEPCSCDDPVESHDALSGRCNTKGCHCREPKPDPAIGTQESYDEMDNKFWIYTNSELFPAYIRWGVADIEGLVIGGVPATVESLLADGTEDLVTELGNVIQQLIRMSPTDLRDFKWPTISGAQVVGQTTDTTAPTAADSDGTKTDVATGSTLN